MSLWERLHNSRKEEAIASYIDGGPVEGASFFDFREMEDDVEKAIKEYLTLPLGKASRELELKVCNGIIKYLLMRFRDPESCGELAISRNLGIPRSRLRRLLANMEWNGIIEGVGVGKATPYIVRNISKAMEEGYLTFTDEEVDKLLKIIRSLGPASPFQPDPRSLLIEAVQSTLPNPEVFGEVILRAVRLFTHPLPRVQQVHRPFIPGGVTTYWEGAQDYQLIQMYSAWTSSGGSIQGILMRDLLLELGVPDKVTDEQLKDGLRRLGEKYLKLTELSVQPLYDEIAKGGFVEARRRIDKGLLRDRLLEMDGVPRDEVHSGERLVGKRSIVPKHGLVTLQTVELTPSHVRLAANILRAACRFAELAGVNPERTQVCSRKAHALVEAVEGM